MPDPNAAGCPDPCIACMTDESHDPAPQTGRAEATGGNKPAAQDLRGRIVQAFLATPRPGEVHRPGHEKWDHHKHGGQPGHNYSISCALCMGDVETLADAALAVLRRTTQPEIKAAVLPAPADQAVTLTTEERQFLTYAIELVAKQMASRRHQFDAADHASLAKFRRMAAQAQQAEPALVHIGWWCWRGDNHGHLAAMACRSDNVPLHVPAEWADEMRAVIQRLEDGDDDSYFTQHRWRVELYDPAAEEWVPGSSLADLATARSRLVNARQRSPKWKDDDTHVQRRIVRETTTYTVESEHAPEQPLQPDGV